ncbi:unnamed protein product [Arctogadus glacialis]
MGARLMPCTAVLPPLDQRADAACCVPRVRGARRLRRAWPPHPNPQTLGHTHLWPRGLRFSATPCDVIRQDDPICLGSSPSHTYSLTSGPERKAVHRNTWQGRQVQAGLFQVLSGGGG